MGLVAQVTNGYLGCRHGIIVPIACLHIKSLGYTHTCTLGRFLFNGMIACVLGKSG